MCKGEMEVWGQQEGPIRSFMVSHSGIRIAPLTAFLISCRLPWDRLSLYIYIAHPSSRCQQGGHIAGAINIPEGDCHLPTVNLTLSSIPKNKVRSHFALETHHHLLPRVR